MTLKGKNIFTQDEISELKRLIKERIKADRSRQKVVRAKMRRIGFYGSHDFGIIDLQPEDFERLIRSGRIKVTGGAVPPKIAPKKISKVVDKPFSNGKLSDNFNPFYPLKNSSSDIPDSPGNYLVCLKKGSDLPNIGVDCIMKKFQDHKVIYTGIAGKSLRKRDYRQHFTGNNAGSSTLRKSLGSMFGFPKIDRDKDATNGKTKFKKIDELKLSEWMASNLVLFFKTTKDPDKLEDALIKEFNPPLNLSKNRNRENQMFRNMISKLRSER